MCVLTCVTKKITVSLAFDYVSLVFCTHICDFHSREHKATVFSLCS